MGNPNVERVYELLAAYLQGNEEKIRQLIDPEGEIYGAPGIVNSGTYRGYEGFRQWVSQWEEAWAEISYDLGEIVELRRPTPTGVLALNLTERVDVLADGTIPFLIDWGDTPHPAPALPSVALASFRLIHPKPSELTDVLAAMGMQVPTVWGVTSGIELLLETASGLVALR